jgi:hypothetical protein
VELVDVAAHEERFTRAGRTIVLDHDRRTIAGLGLDDGVGGAAAADGAPDGAADAIPVAGDSPGVANRVR